MGDYEPRDSRNVTQNPNRALGEPPRTGPRESVTRAAAQQPDETELSQDERGQQVEATVAVEQQQQQSSRAQRRQAAAQDVDVPSAPGDPGRFDRND